MMRKEDEVWVGAYAVAMSMLLLGRAARGDAPDVSQHVDAIDESAKLVADRVQKTIEERAALAAKEQRK